MRPFRLFPITLVAVLLLVPYTAAQQDPYEFYAAFRAWARPVTAELHGDQAAVLQRYRDKLRAEGVDAKEIDRRIHLIETDRERLETEFWNRFFTNPAPNSFNREANEFLVSMARGRKPGRALDVGMGDGRNAVYLAQQGWDVTGFDPAARAMVKAQQLADRTGLKLKTVVAKMEDFDFGVAQWDLILFSWVPLPGDTPRKVERGLTPGGIVVVEGQPAWFGGDNGLLRMLPGLRALRYEDTIAPSDFFNRQEMRVLRYCGEKRAGAPQ